MPRTEDDDKRDAERRDAVLRRMLATPKPGKGGKKDREPKPVASGRPAKAGGRPAKTGG